MPSLEADVEKWRLSLISLGLVLALALAGGGPVAAGSRVIMVATGEAQGVFNAVGAALVSVLKKDLPGRQFQISNSTGARTNCKVVGEAVMDLGLAQGETLHFAATGDPQGGFDRPLPDLRAVAALYANYLHVMVGKGSKIDSLEGMKGKRINMGPAGSGTSVTAGVLLNALGFKSLDLSRQKYRPLAENPGDFRQGNTDVAFVMEGLPSEPAAKTLAAGAVLMPIPPEAFQKMAGYNSQYHHQPIPRGAYPGQDQDVPTVIINTILITNAEMDNETIYHVTKALFDHAPELARAHPAGKEISLQGAAHNLPVPLHPGAERYYREKGVLK